MWWTASRSRASQGPRWSSPSEHLSCRRHPSWKRGSSYRQASGGAPHHEPVGREKKTNEEKHIILPRPICRNVLEDFCCINFGGFSQGFSCPPWKRPHGQKWGWGGGGAYINSPWIQTHPNLHSPVWVGSKRSRPQRGGTNLGVFVPIWPVMRLPG